ncbi:hypothetical protein BD770DRAFT_386821 [Pilaira anomala]|nr:hypothetical protein BD770DRAFT_386821 [Pilaira anomala]
MYVVKSVQGLQATILFLLLNQINSIQGQASCVPKGCSQICEPACLAPESCARRTMTECGICPINICVSSTILKIPEEIPSPSPEKKTNNAPMIGGIVGGLLGVGIIVSIGFYLYIRKKRRTRGKLPFAFTDGSANATSMMSQDQFHLPSPPTTPHPGVIAALSQQQRELRNQQEGAHIKRKWSGLSELAASSNLPPPPPPPPTSSSSRSSTMMHSSNEGYSVTTNVPEEFEEKIALQNKRISHILNNNPRLSCHQLQPSLSPPMYAENNRNSELSFTTTDEEESDYEIEENQPHQPAATAAAVILQRQPTIQAVQVNRAKPHIMRVNSVRKSSHLSRSGSVRTILTSMETSSQPSSGGTHTPPDNIADQFPDTPSNRSFVVEDPFQDKRPKF